MGGGAEYSVQGDITRAATLPGSFHRDAEAFARLRETAFVPAWHLVGDATMVRSPGDVAPVMLYEGFLDEPLLLARGEDDTVRCLSNVCTHRGALLVDGPCRLRTIRCRYHGRRFGLDGAFQSMPEFDGAQGFPRPEDSLPRLATHQWGPLLFASLAPGAPFDEWFGPVLDRVGWLPIDEFRFDAARSRDYLVHAHWALYCDNYLEGFHIPFVHHSLNEALDYGEYRTELWRWGSMQLGVGKGGEEAFELPPGHPDEGRRVVAWYFWLFPNLMLNFYPWGLSVNVVKPIRPDLTRVSFMSFVWREEKLSRGAGAELDRVEREDEEVVESVQRGLRSRLYTAGRFSPSREQGVHHFHRLLAEALSGG